MHGASSVRLMPGDVGCALFPKGGIVPAEDLLAAVRLILFQLVAGIERQLLRDGSELTTPRSWLPLCEAGLLRDDQLIAFCLARHAERRLQRRLFRTDVDILEQIPSVLLRADDQVLADAARKVVAGENLLLAENPATLVEQLPAELFHALAWKIVAALHFQGVIAAQGGQLADVCRARLAQRDEGNALQLAAAKLAHFIPEEFAGSLRNVRRTGISLFVAALSRDLGLAHDQLCQLLDHVEAAPALILLRAAGVPTDTAMATMQSLRTEYITGHRQAIAPSDFEAIALDDALSVVRQWHGTSMWTSGNLQ